MLKLPAPTHPARQFFDVAHLAALLGSEKSKLCGFRETLSSSRKFLATEKAARSVYAFTLRADGALWLVKVTPKAWSKVWDFGVDSSLGVA